MVLAIDSWNYYSRARLDSPAYLKECIIFFTQVNDVYKWKIRSCHLMLNSLDISWHNIGNSTFSFSICPVLILHRYFWDYLLGTRDTYVLTAQHIHKTSNKSMFDTCQQFAYALWLMIVFWTGCWCQFMVVIYVGNILSNWRRNSGLVTWLQDWYQGNIGSQGHRHNSTQDSTKRHRCLSNTI